MPNASRPERQTEDDRSSVLHTETVSRKMNEYEDVRRLMRTTFPPERAGAALDFEHFGVAQKRQFQSLL